MPSIVGKEYLIEYKKDAISEYLSKHEEYKKIGSTSGNVGFYSGAKLLEEEIQNEIPEQFSNRRIPGMSSLVYLPVHWICPGRMFQL